MENEITNEQDRDAAFTAAANELLGDNTMPVEATQPEVKEVEEVESKETEVELDEFEKAAKQLQPEVEEEEQQNSQDDDDDDDLPRSWKKKDQEVWNKVPPEARAIVKRREMELTKPLNRKINEYHELTTQIKKELGPVVDVLDEYKPLLKEIEFSNTPLTPAQTIKRALEAYQYLRSTDNLTIAKQFIKAAGARPQDLIELEQNSENEKIQSLQEKVNVLESSLTANVQSAQQAQFEQIQSKLSQAYNKMANTVNVAGEKKYPTASIQGFAQQMGSLAITRAAQYPHLDESAILAMVYNELGGEIRQGRSQNSVARSAQNNQNNKIAQTTVVGKGSRSSQGQQLFESDDDAWAATAEEFGLI